MLDYLLDRGSWLVGGIAVGLIACAAPSPSAEALPQVPQWTTFEIELLADSSYANPYTDVSVWAEFRNASGDSLHRPAFWDGSNRWVVRFAPPDTGAVWSWRSFASNEADMGLHNGTGRLRSVPYAGDDTLLQHGLLRMSPGHRSVVHADGTPFLLVADTPWALPFRATVAQAERYARDRRDKGFNAALLMSIQPDQNAEGPDARNTPLGFARGFADLSAGQLNELQPAYFQYLDSLVAVLLDHGIVPVHQPVFHGFGWKGLDVLGNHVAPAEYERYCRYLLARYGSRPAIWLIAADNGGRDPGVEEAGRLLEAEDAYAQPTGLHYNPCDDYVADWAKDNPLKHCLHYNRSFQNADWLDFQWAQTGHDGEHQYYKVERMYRYQPPKAVANGEPTYEGMNGGKNGLGWWQGEEAWLQLLSGGTMGVVYGAASLWQWKITADEPGWTPWAEQPKSWEEALQMEGATYVGQLGKILAPYDLTDIEIRPELSLALRPLLAREDQLYISLLTNGNRLSIPSLPAGLKYVWIDPRTGEIEQSGTTKQGQSFQPPNAEPWVWIAARK